MKIIDYIVVEGYTKTVLMEQVNEKIKEGWQPIGGVAVKAIVNFDAFYQGMVKYEN